MMMNKKIEYVFGLDIGTRSIVGTVGYQEGSNHFVVLAQVVKEHETRAVIDGQIHDIVTVANTIKTIKRELEDILGFPLRDVCIAAAGRVLKTEKVMVENTFASEIKVTEEHIRSLNMLGVEKAYERICQQTKEEGTHFYCVGYSTIGYYLNGYEMSTIEMHKGTTIGVELIATFLPDEVVDGLYTAVEEAGLQVANLTLEPIAAINVAIPENFRLLNIALVDVGAGTSDISIVKDGSIIAFGMMPLAGDEMTEAIAKKYLVDFHTAEKAKKMAAKRKVVSFKNIMGEALKVSSADIFEATDDAVRMITKKIAAKIKELNGNKNVSAVFIVGGGGKLASFTSFMAEFLELPENRVAIRGAEVLQNVEFRQASIKKDSTLVTPIGICLNYYEQKNNFIHVMVNDIRVKLYDNNKLTVLDAAIQIGFSQDQLFPKRGNTIGYSVNGQQRLAKGSMGEPAEIIVGTEHVSLNHKIVDQDIIKIKAATVGVDGESFIGNLPECKKELQIDFLGKTMLFPKKVEVNGAYASSEYKIKDKDNIQIMNSYTVGQLFEYMGIEPDGDFEKNGVKTQLEDTAKDGDSIQQLEVVPVVEPEEVKIPEVTARIPQQNSGVYVKINGDMTRLLDKDRHIFVDVFDAYPFDLTSAGGKRLVSKVNGREVDFTEPIEQGDEIDLIWGDS